MSNLRRPAPEKGPGRRNSEDLFSGLIVYSGGMASRLLHMWTFKDHGLSWGDKSSLLEGLPAVQT